MSDLHEQIHNKRAKSGRAKIDPELDSEFFNIDCLWDTWDTDELIKEIENDGEDGKLAKYGFKVSKPILEDYGSTSESMTRGKDYLISKLKKWKVEIYACVLGQRQLLAQLNKSYFNGRAKYNFIGSGYRLVYSWDDSRRTV